MSSTSYHTNKVPLHLQEQVSSYTGQVGNKQDIESLAECDKDIDTGLVFDVKNGILGITCTDEIKHVRQSDLAKLGYSLEKTILVVSKDIGSILFSKNIGLISYLSEVKKEVQLSLVNDAIDEKIAMNNSTLH